MSQSQWQSQNPNSMPDRSKTVNAPEVVEYICGDCGVKSAIRVNETIRCKECGHRVMYKPRTHRIVGCPTAIHETKMQDSADHIYRSNSKLVSHILLPQFGLFQVL